MAHERDPGFDARIPEILEGPLTRPDGIWTRFALVLRRAGVPELRLEGAHLTVYADGRALRMLAGDVSSWCHDREFRVAEDDGVAAAPSKSARARSSKPSWEFPALRA